MNYIKLSILMLLIFFSLITFSQNIGITDFIQMLKKDKEAIKSELNSFNIQLYDSEELNNNKTQYSFENNNDIAASLKFDRVNLLYVQGAPWNNRISFQTQEIEFVKKYLVEMKKLGFYFTNKKIVDRRVYEVYSDGENVIELINSQIKKVDTQQSSYIFAFYSADEYKYAFENETKVCSVPHNKQNTLFAKLNVVSVSGK